MVDHYHLGFVERMCPEASGVPVFCENGSVVVPGGAGNVARQFMHWNVESVLFSMIDEPSQQLLHRHNLLTESCVRLPDRGRCPVKHRYMDETRLLFRCDDDCEDTWAVGYENDSGRKELINRFGQMVDGLDAVVIADYGKGTLSERMVRDVITACNLADVPTIVDPCRTRKPDLYDGCTVFKSNAWYDSNRGRPGDCNAVVVTSGSNQPVCLAGDKTHMCIGRPPVTSASAVGAGDCFAAHLAISMAHYSGLVHLPDTVEFAHSAGRSYVQRLFNCPVMPHEVLADTDPSAAKITTVSELEYILGVRQDRSRSEGSRERVILAPGCFDLLSPGHCATLQWAHQQGDVLVVGVNSDASVTRLKGPGRPVRPLPQRLASLAALECVSFVVPFDDDTSVSLLDSIRPDVLVKGPEWAGRLDRVPGYGRVPNVLAAPVVFDGHTTGTIEYIRATQEVS